MKNHLGIDPADLDRYITGNYGENQLKEQYEFTTQAQVRAAFWQGWPEGFQRGKKHNEYNVTIRSEFSAFVDMLQKDGHISEALADRVTL